MTSKSSSALRLIRVIGVCLLLLLAVFAVSCGGSPKSRSKEFVEETTTESPSTTTSEAITTSSSEATSTTIAGSTFAPLAVGSLAGKVIAIDPGHNGKNYAHSAEIAQQVNIGTKMKECDTTGTATYGGYSETAHNWDVAQRLSAILRGAGATVVFTRPDDNGWGPCITERAAIGNNAHADVAISVHADGGPDSGTGFHVLYPALVAGMTESIVEPSKRLAYDVRDAFAKATGMPYASYLGSQGLMERSDLGGLNLSMVPKVFVEAGNMRNAGDAARLADSAFRQKEAEGLATGIVKFLSAF